jgi:hypothetical protein
MIRQLLAARIHFTTSLHKTFPFKPKSLFLMELLVSLKSQWVGKDCLATCKIAAELDADQAFLVIQYVAADIIRATKRRLAILYWARQSLTGLDLLAPQLMRAQAPVGSKDLAASGDGTLQLDPCVTLSVYLEVIFETLGRCEGLVASRPGARKLASGRDTCMTVPMTG